VNSPLRLLQVAWAASWVEDWLLPVAVGIYAFGIGGASAAGIAGVVRMLPSAVAAPVLGLLVDRWPRRRVLALAFVVQAGACAAMAAAFWLGASLSVLYVFLAIEGFVSVLIQPATSALVPWIARTPAELYAANTSLSVLRSAGIFIGPLLAAAVLATTDAGTAFALGGAFMLLSFVLTLRMRVNVPAAVAPSVKKSWVHELSAGFRALAADPSATWIAVLLSSVQGVLRGIFSVLSVVVAVELLGVPRSSAGYLQAAAGLGGVIAGVVLARRLETGSLAAAFTFGVVLRTAPFALIAVAPMLLPAMAFMALTGVGNTTMVTGGLSLLQRLVPNEVTGRALGAVGMATTLGVAAGSAVAPAALAVTSPRAVLIGIGVLWPLLALAGWWTTRGAEARVAASNAEIALLRAVPFLAPLPLVALETCARFLVRQRVPAGKTIVQQGENGDRFYLLVRGRASASIDGQQVNTIEQGGWFGEIALVHDVGRTATVRMLEDGEIAFLLRPHFLEALTVDAAASELAATVWEGERLGMPAEPSPDVSPGELLARLPLLARAPREEVAALAARAREVEIGAREEVYAQGAPADDMYVVIEGRVDIVTNSQVVAEIGRGGWFGELALLHDEPRRSTVRASVPSVLLRVDGPGFVRLAKNDALTI